MAERNRLSLEGIDENDALASILKGTASTTGDGFFSALVEELATVLDTHVAWVTEYDPHNMQLNVLAYHSRDDLVMDPHYKIGGTPCEPVILESTLIHVPDDVQAKFPHDTYLKDVGVRSYLGFPLVDADAAVLGHLAVMDTRPMAQRARLVALFKIFAARAAAEVQRLRAEALTRAHEDKLSRIVNGAMDAIVELDESLTMLLANPAAAELLRLDKDDWVGTSFEAHLSPDSAAKLRELIAEFKTRATSYVWIPGGLQLGHGDSVVAAEATLSHFEINAREHYTLILRDVNARLAAEQQIESLSLQTRYLNEELQTLIGADEIIGRSPALNHVLREVEQVAPTDATVLVLGETGTGKELVARALHKASRRSEQPLIKVNCGALPESLIESELFGHERGAFTGATAKREGRFSLADGGTIFLDEVGDLALDLQVKLLRVLQEGEFEALGSGVTRKVDVRVIAATNRGLYDAVQAGEFREDLYYRLAVFPIELPALRNRPEDIPALAAAFVERYARSLGRLPPALDDRDIERLIAYHWPGNVRELQNVVERAVITAENGRLNWDRALPETRLVAGEPIRLASELEALERANMIAALEQANWQVSGANGAANLLGINPSTLNSRLKALGIKKPK